MANKKLPSFDKYYMDIAEAVSKRANCIGKKVGAIIVVGNRIVSTGYNGVPEGMKNCMDGGCKICLWKKKARDKNKGFKEKRKGSGKRYDDCICVHAEQNALMTAARNGISIENGYVYSVYQPCFGCLKQMLQAKIRKVVYKHNFIPSDRRLIKPYQDIQDEFPESVLKLRSDKYLEVLSKKRELKSKK